MNKRKRERKRERERERERRRKEGRNSYDWENRQCFYDFSKVW